MQLIYQEPDKPKTSYTMDEDGGGLTRNKKYAKFRFVSFRKTEEQAKFYLYHFAKYKT
jgi:hypothetical protein